MATMTYSRPVAHASWRPQRLAPAVSCSAAHRACLWTPSSAAHHTPAAVSLRKAGSTPLHSALINHHHSSSSSSRRGMRLCSTAMWVPPLAMVNVDFASPSLVLGFALIACGIALLQARNLQRRVSRDADIVVAAMISIVGSTLIFQGWRLDPLLLLCQALTTSVALWYGLETFKLRSELGKQDDDQQPAQLPGPQDMYRPGAPEEYGRGGMAPTSRGGYLPPGRMAAPWEASQLQQQQGELEGSSRWGRPYEDVARGYDAYARPAAAPLGGPYADPLAPAGMPGPSTSGGSGGQQGGLPPYLPAGPPGEGYAPGTSGTGYEAGPSGVPGQVGGGGYGQWYGPQGQEYGPPAAGDPYGPPADYPGQQQQQYPQQQQQQQQLPGGYGQPPYDPAAAAAAAGAPGAAPPPSRQQQQQQPAGARPRDYERIDDWE